MTTKRTLLPRVFGRPRGSAPGAILIVALLLGLVPASSTAEPVCTPENSHVWFLGIVYDAAKREDFVLDVGNLELYLSTLRTVHCIPEENAKILAFEDGYALNGTTYDTASEANVKTTLTSFGAAASQYPDSLLFFMLSSHGIMYASRTCPGGPGGRRVPGSLAALKQTAGQDGDLYDCELGQALNSNFAPTTRMVILVDCSFCGGFSDSLTAVSGTLPDDTYPVPSGIVTPGRVVITGCAITTECFGSDGGGVSYKHLSQTIAKGIAYCDGFTAPGFPTIQGINYPVKDVATNPPDGRCTASEWVFGAVDSAYDSGDLIGIQQQFRMKYGFATLAEDIQIF